MSTTTICRRAYAGALTDACPQCKAPAGEYCTRLDDFGHRHLRRIPCLHRIHPSLVDVDEHHDEPVDFTEPRRPPNEGGRLP
ncbi:MULTISPECIES: hypothetical protein [Mycobacteriaceae]|uniref:Uncharacterized protein n=1 Tax=Mycolicibacterium neoaurum VKM Ac-1815D TaxID=700508 RepID=V5XIY0_MYCNE|nr:MULTISPECIES: hypothetical protein [Mycobacteriaceae]AHC28022.1 hypothetical protein D174_19420 [Mycolicibacterium neoaurum VKM Ac-1815D]AMO06926.1 hypothetical protein MyAD_19050 [Mycolicibacterium neoaurum]AXK74711.1 hypothetical protein DXK33_05890 [Mycolicibacterium neoaurum]KJQ48102.1 hypothetical protein TS71_23040 [Mycolicibacterium neoaurum]KUM06137.1 hypothetical protein AVZ31_22910 [Mycolicibacterium neoaurum]